MRCTAMFCEKPFSSTLLQSPILSCCRLRSCSPFYLILSYLILSYLILSYLFLSYLTFSWLNLSYLVTSSYIKVMLAFYNYHYWLELKTIAVYYLTSTYIICGIHVSSLL